MSLPLPLSHSQVQGSAAGTPTRPQVKARSLKPKVISNDAAIREQKLQKKRVLRLSAQMQARGLESNVINNNAATKGLQKKRAMRHMKTPSLKSPSFKTESMLFVVGW